MTQHNTTGPRPTPQELPGSPHPAGASNAAGPDGQGACRYAARVSAYHDGEVSQVEARELTQHVAECPACAAQLAFFGRVSRTFEAAALPHLDSDAKQRLESLDDRWQSDNGQGDDGRGDRARRMRIKPPADVRWVRRLSAAAAILFVVAAGKVIYEQKFAGHDGRGLTPVSQPKSPNAPAVTNTGFVQGQPPFTPPTTGQSQKP